MGRLINTRIFRYIPLAQTRDVTFVLEWHYAGGWEGADESDPVPDLRIKSDADSPMAGKSDECRRKIPEGWSGHKEFHPLFRWKMLTAPTPSL
ncbi:hypothetical protein CEXT_180681 [Caerostris extrusa]|uniref:Uncharacterized protein n=1 Tax=Caerostris extrusa TaxID=172846 RepID=A0AAV4XGI8_CAEEX|nr:hypothetical protein CEXT_180681 [Caerostris extrusa]